MFYKSIPTLELPPGHFLADVTVVAAEGAGVLNVAGNLGDELGSLDLFV